MKSTTTARILPLLIYVLPAIADMVVAQFFFINAVRLARLGASASVVANTITVWSLVYLGSCWFIGKHVTSANAGRLMVTAMTLMSAISLLFTAIPSITGVYALMALAGVSASLFFVPFQVFMKAVDGQDNKSVAYSAGLYTFAWSLGFACGPFVSGLLMDLGTAAHPGWMFACWFAAGAAALTALGCAVLKRLVLAAPGTPPRPGTAAEPGGGVDYTTKPDLAWLGWTAAGTGILVLSFIRGIFPVRAENALHLTQSLQGVLFFLLSLVQGITGFFLRRSRLWMYGSGVVSVFGVAGVLGALALGLAHTPVMLGLGAILFGLYAGGFFFYLVFHALVHPEHSGRYVAINEVVVGVSSLVGAMLGGWIADRFGFGSLYSIGGALILGTVAFQALMAHRSTTRVLS